MQLRVGASIPLLTLLMLGIGLFTSDVRSARYALP